MARDGTSLKARAIVFALAAGAVAFILSIIPNLGDAGREDAIWRAVIPAVVMAAMCWAAAERAVAAIAEAIDVAIERLTRAARGDLASAIPAQVVECVPQLAATMDDLFRQLTTSMGRIERLARFDSVTGLANRDHFRDECERLIGGAAQTGPATLLFIDLDRFKAVNDTLGHAAGDQVLVQVGQRLRAVVAAAASANGSAPLVGRLAGDEFTVFLPAVDGREAVAIGEAIWTALTEAYAVDGRTVTLGASIGLAHYPVHGTTVTDLISAADGAMYRAKAAGRGGIEVHVPTMAGGGGAGAVDALLAVVDDWRGGRLSLDLDPSPLHQADGLRRLAAALAAKPADVELVFGEAALMTLPPESIAVLEILRGVGAKVALRGFGRSCADPARLRTLPLDRIKLDRVVTVDIAADVGARTLAQALVGLIHAVGCEAVAEGVSARTEADMLRVIGCAVVAEADGPDQPSARFSTAA